MKLELYKNNELIFEMSTEDENVDSKAKELRENYSTKIIEKIEFIFVENVDLNIANDILSDVVYEGIKTQKIYLK